MKLTPWLRSLKNGIARAFKQAKSKPRAAYAGRAGLLTSCVNVEMLEDRALLAVAGYFTTVADGVYAKDVLLQTLPASPITLPNDLNGQPAIKFTVTFDQLTSVNVSAGRPFITFNTNSNNPNSPNYLGLSSVAVYEGPSVNNVLSLDFYYVIQNGQNTPGPLQIDPVLTVTGGGNPNGCLTDAGGPVNMTTPVNAGKIKDFSGLDKFIYIDTTPIVLNVNAAPAATIDSLPYNDDPNAGVIRRPYRVGDPPIEIVVSLSEPVVITGTPTLQLNIINTITLQNATAVYVSGSGTNQLHYLYTVSPGDNTNDLDVKSATPFLLTNATLKDRDFVPDDPSGYVPNVSSGLSTVGPNGVNPGILGSQRAIQVDTTTPIVGPPVGQTAFTGVTAKNINGTYGTGQTLTISVQFNEAVVLTGTPTLLLQTSPNGGVATFSGLEGGDTLLFTYVIKSGDSTDDLDYLNPNALQLNGGSLTDLAGNAAILTLPAPGSTGSLSANRNIKIDTTLAVTNVSTTLPNGSYGVGQVIPIQVQFNNGKTVNVIGTPQLILKLDSPTNSVIVDYSSGSGTNVLTFLYTIQAGHNAADLDYLSASALQLNGGAILDGASGGAAILTLPLPGSQGSLGFNKNITIDSVRPNVSSVSAAPSVPNGVYVEGQVIPITVTFSEPVSVTGTPQIYLETNGIPGIQLAGALQPGEVADAVVNYSSGSGLSTLTFNYTVQKGQNSLDLEAIQLVVPPGSLIKDVGGNDLYDAAAVGNVFPLPQVVNEHMSTTNQVANVPAIAKIESFSVGFSVVPGEQYRINVTTVNGTFNASYTAVTGDFATDVALGLRQAIASSGIGIALAVAGNNNQFTLTAKTAGDDFTVNSTTVVPVAPAVVPTGSFTHFTQRANTPATPQVDKITVLAPAVGTVFELTINGTAIRYDSNTTDPVVAAAAIANLINQKLPTAVDATANSNEITVTSKVAGAPVTISVLHALASLRDIIVNTAPLVTNVSSPQTEAGNPYSNANSDEIFIDVTFSEPVFVDTTFGVPSLILETNGTPWLQTTAVGNVPADASAIFDSVISPNTVRFRYTVGPNDSSVALDVAVAFNNDVNLRKSVVQLNGGFITDAAVGGKALNPLLPAPGTSGSLSVNRTLQVDSIDNDAPVNLIPGTQTIIEDVVGGLVFSTANGNRIQIADVDSTTLTVTLTAGPAGHGTITLPIETGLTVTGNGTGTVTITGDRDLINNRLDGLIFTPKLNDNSSVVAGISLTISTSDSLLADTDVIPITVTAVNDAPVANSQTIATAVGTSVTIVLSATDVDLLDSLTYALDPAVALSLRTQHGTVTAISGGNSLTYTPDAGYIGPDSFTFTAKDATLTSNLGVITINVVPTVTSVGFANVQSPEGNSGTTVVTMRIVLSQAPVQPITIDYTTVDGVNAFAGIDYQAKSGTVQFIPGQTEATFTVNLIGNTSDEPNKVFSVNLSNPTNVVLQDTSATVTILNDDGMSIDSVTQTEGDNGTTVFNFTVSLSTAQPSNVSVQYITSNGTANSGTDYVATGGTLVFTPGETSKTISVTVNGDTLDEANETFFVDLFNIMGGPSLGQSRGIGTIQNDDTAPTYSIIDAQVSEGNSGTKMLRFLVNLSGPSGQVVTVNYSTADLPVSSTTAVAGVDYQSKTGTVTFLPGQTTQFIDVPLIGDTTIENDETFLVNLTSAVNASAGNTVGVGTIANDDGVVATVTPLLEGNTGIKQMAFTVTVPAGTPDGFVVNYTTTAAGVGPGFATPGVDYTSVSGSLTFTTGVTSQTINVPIIGDFDTEAAETFFLDLSYANPVGAPPLVTPRVTGTILNDDATPEITVSDVTIEEGDVGVKNAVFTINLSFPLGIAVSVDYATFSDPDAIDAATPGSDYVATAGTLTFAPNQTVRTIVVPIRGDTLDELNEKFTLHLSNAVNATFTDADPVATITDNDQAPSLVLNNISFDEGNGGPRQVFIPVSLSTASGQVVTVNYSTVDGSAVSVNTGTIGDRDYTSQTGTLTFAPGETTKNIVITIDGDSIYEANDSFVITFTNLVNVTSTPLPQAVVTIKNDDPQPTVVINDVTNPEGNSGVTPFQFTVALQQPSALPVTVTYSTSPNTAQNGDFLSQSNQTVTFNPGETTKIITVNVLGDSTVESNETFFVNLISATNAQIIDPLGVGTITNDDEVPSLQISDAQILEGDAGTTLLVFTVTRTGSTALPSTVGYSTSNGTATAGLDFTSASGTLSFAANDTTKTIVVAIKGDTSAEPDETFFVNLSNPTNATLADGQGVGTILNDDNIPPVVTLPVGPLSATEEVNLSITGIAVSDQDAGQENVTVTLVVANGTLAVRSDVVNGVTAGQIQNNGTGTVTLTAPIAAINQTLANSTGLVYRGFTDFFGVDSLTVTANDLGHTSISNVPQSDTKVVSINVANVNDAPVIDFEGDGGGNPVAITSTKGSEVPVFGTPNTTAVVDTDNSNFNGGRLTVSIVGFSGKKDKLAIRNDGTGSGFIGFKKGQVTYGGQVIGTVSGGKGSDPLVIVLNNRATAEATEALTRNITFTTAKAKLNTTPRTVRMTLTDGSGGSSTPVNSTINLTN